MNEKLTKQLQRLLNELAPYGYSCKRIDYENCLYKDFGDFDIEGSGLNQQGKRKNTIFVWRKRPYLYVYLLISCKSANETKEACMLIEKAVKDNERGLTADYPFQILFSDDYGHCSQHFIAKKKGKWVKQEYLDY